MRLLTLLIIPLLAASSCSLSAKQPQKKTTSAAATSVAEEKVAKALNDAAVAIDSLVESEEPQILRLTEDDYVAVAQRLGVEVASIKAVTEIEAGKTHEGFSAPGLPLVNFDLTMFKRFAGKRGINLSKYYKSHPQVFRRSGGSSQANVNKRLKAARSIDNNTAIEGTFWGMFQIGGFNWKLCGCSSIDEFLELMSRSERDQLELFANFISNSGLLKYLKAKNWTAFARGYNGPSYASRRYHTRLASAYAKYKKSEPQPKPTEEE